MTQGFTNLPNVTAHEIAPVASVGILPATGNTVGGIRYVEFDDKLYTWDGSAWNVVGGGSGTVTGVQGDVTGSGSGNINTTISAGAVTSSKLAAGLSYYRFSADSSPTTTAAQLGLQGTTAPLGKLFFESVPAVSGDLDLGVYADNQTTAFTASVRNDAGKDVRTAALMFNLFATLENGNPPVAGQETGSFYLSMKKAGAGSYQALQFDGFDGTTQIGSWNAPSTSYFTYSSPNSAVFTLNPNYTDNTYKFSNLNMLGRPAPSGGAWTTQVISSNILDGSSSRQIGSLDFLTDTPDGAINTSSGDFALRLYSNTNNALEVAGLIDFSQTTSFGRRAAQHAGFGVAPSTTAFGSDALSSNSLSGINNSAFGVSAGASLTTGTNNTFVGYQAGKNNAQGYSNVAMGYQAGLTNTSGAQNVLIGAGADVGSNSLQNATAIGAGAIVSASNAMVLGNNVNVGIGTSTPGYNLHVLKAGGSAIAADDGNVVSYMRANGGRTSLGSYTSHPLDLIVNQIAVMTLSAGSIGFFGTTPAYQQTGGAATAGGTYGSTEQTMLQKVYNALRTYGLLT